MDVNSKGGAHGPHIEVFHNKVAGNTEKILKSINEKSILELSQPKCRKTLASNLAAPSPSSQRKPAQKVLLPQEKLARGGLVVAVKKGLGEARPPLPATQQAQMESIRISRGPKKANGFSSVDQNVPIKTVQSAASQSLVNEKDQNDRLKITAETIHLDTALKASKAAGNNSELKATIYFVEIKVGSIVQSKPAPNTPLANAITAYQEKLAECKEQRSILLSEKKLETINIIMKDIGSKNINQNKLVAEVRQVTKTNAHAFEINGVTYILSKNLPGKGNTNAIPAIWKRESRPFAEGAYGFIYGGEYIGKTGAGRSDVMKEAKTYPEELDSQRRGSRVKRANADLQQEVSSANKIHGNGLQKGVVPPPHTVLYGGKTGYLVDRQKMDGIDFGHEIQKMNLSPVAIEKIIETATAGLNVIHDKGYYHGDIKPENMLWDGKSLLIADLGGVKKMMELVPLDHYPESHADFVGTHTAGYLSEEVFENIDRIINLNEKHYNEETDPIKKKAFLTNIIERRIFPLLKQNDAFALGMTLYMCLTAKLPPCFQEDEIYSFVTNKDFENMNKVLSLFTKNAQDMIFTQVLAPYK